MSGSDQRNPPPALTARERAALADLRAAHAHHRAGDLVRAEAGYRRVLKREPEHPGALHLLGLTAIARGEWAAAEQFLQRALKAMPNLATARMDLGSVLGRLNRPSEAEAAYRAAIASDPELASARVNLAMLLNERGAHEEAVEQCRAAVRLSQGLMEAHLVLAGTLRAMGDLQAAEQAYRVAAALRSDRAETHSDLATLLGEMRRFAEAMERHRRAIALNGDSPLLHRAQASTLERMGDLAGAEAAYTQAITRSPLDLTSWLSRGACLAGLGRFAEADACFTRVIQADPAAMAAHWQRARIHTLPDAAEPALRSALADPATTPMRAVFAGFALAPLLEGQHRHDDAFAVIAEANARFRALRAAAGQSFDPDRLDAEIDTLIAATPASLFQRLSSWAVETELPVFLVGMPRSGISLVEQILASHPEVHAAGPLHRMAALNALLAGENPDRPNLADWDPVLARKTAEDHLAGLSRLGAGKARVVDATPDNILLLGLIAALFPRARVVLCTRGRRDLCVSNLFTLFTEGNLFSRDLAHCARRAAALDQLTAHWRAVLPLRMHEIRYEELVTRPEPAIRGLLEFLALDWHPGCMEFHTTDRPVLSAPVWEVRQPLTARGIGRARPYSAQLDGSGL